MDSEIIVRINKRYIKKYKEGYPLIFKEAVNNIHDLKGEGAILKLVDDKNKFVARGYFGRQNKGYGWVLTRKDEAIDRKFFQNKIITALNKRAPFYFDEDTTAYRVFNGEGDGIGGFTIDNYDGYYLINWYSKGIYRFKDIIVEILSRMVVYKGIYQKKRFDDGIEEDDFVMGEKGEFPIIVRESGVNFAIYLDEGDMTGVFLDQREVRKRIRDKYSKGKTVLNTFSYTGAFSVFAALGDAKSTTSVDLANRSLEKTTEQFNINGLDLDTNHIVVEDVFNYFKYAAKKEMKFDLVILDPPSFAKSKKNIFSADRDYKDLLKEVIDITEDGGVIAASTNCASFNMDKFKKFIDTAFVEKGKRYRILEEHSLPVDFATIEEFREGNYLKVVFISVS
ncbi:23S rRNA (cytosine1962-C5)-methyltransferase [Dethiosulfatibacter aminovorans DSM 17477]|uniref:23S rRNA (Cytosine1962-C5)-methyltransferase n=1 Tax=Dethiosulfatibacter aminovorans DSM 17477 TaxID=1121476 RepID=A0A1M6BT88_9FIRM|nr:class I SAM-dependent rRNA methyltransferase [Dethiosulfatibacter aminovorans]SHI51698.1 23S rRNA (cytosine1962-C5)-methyltransferase [Dethiosulfatibacter aminovorans DSM 17477]